MGVKKFIENVLNAIKLDGFELSSKKKSLKNLLKKLKQKRLSILKELDNESDQTKRALIKEEFELISFHIQKGKEKLNELKKS